MPERTNEAWLDDLRADGLRRTGAIEDLRARLERGLLFYLSRDRSDLSERPTEELQQMAQDFAQDAILKILDSLDTFRGESQFTTWASKIAAHVAISELRRVRYKDYSLDHLTIEGEVMPSVTSLDIAPDQAPHPEEYAERQEVLGILDHAINHALTERQRIALTSAVFDGVPIDEIAKRMDTNRNALYKLIHDARFKLKHYMEEQGLSMEYLLELFEAA